MDLLRKFTKHIILLGSIIILSLIFLVFYLKIKDNTFYPNEVKSKHIVLISIESLSSNDFDKISSHENFKTLIKKGSYTKELVGVYPQTLNPTYSSIVTGKKPNRHQVNSNKSFDPLKESTWINLSSNIKETPIWDTIKKYNMKSCALMWPLVSKSNIDYYYPLINPLSVNVKEKYNIENDSKMKKFISELDTNFAKKVDGYKQPELDEFVINSFEKVIKEKIPNLTLIKLSELDTSRRLTGLSTNKDEIFKSLDDKIGKIINILKKAKIYEDTSIIVIGACPNYEVVKNVKINKLLLDKNFITAEGGKIKDWKAYFHPNEGCGFLQIKKNDDMQFQRELTETIFTLVNSTGENCIQNIYPLADSEKFRSGVDSFYTIEAKTGYKFIDGIDGNIISEVDKSKIDIQDNSLAAAGLNPKYTTIFIASGSGIRNNINMDSIEIVDIAPTIASLFGTEIIDPDGRVLDEIIK